MLNRISWYHTPAGAVQYPAQLSYTVLLHDLEAHFSHQIGGIIGAALLVVHGDEPSAAAPPPYKQTLLHHSLSLSLTSITQVADVCVEALVCPAAEGKVVEVIAEKGAPALSIEALFEGVSMTWP